MQKWENFKRNRRYANEMTRHTLVHNNRKIEKKIEKRNASIGTSRETASYLMCAGLPITPITCFPLLSQFLHKLSKIKTGPARRP